MFATLGFFEVERKLNARAKIYTRYCRICILSERTNVECESKNLTVSIRILPPLNLLVASLLLTLNVRLNLEAMYRLF